MTHDELLEKIALDFEKKTMEEIISNAYSYNDCAVRAKMWLNAANAIRKYKNGEILNTKNRQEINNG